MSNDKSNKALSESDELGLVVHSYNNHLAAMMGYIELLLMQQENGSSKEYLNHALDSGNESVHFGKTILASISRLQVSMEDHSFIKLIQPFIQNDCLNISLIDLDDKLQIKTNSEWFNECLNDLIEFILILDINQKALLKISMDDNEKKLRMVIETLSPIKKEIAQESLFMPFYSSRCLLGTKDIGLAKAKGFFKQMDSNLSWINNQGFCLEIPISN